MRKKPIIFLMIAVLLAGCRQQMPNDSLFEAQMDRAMALARQYGPLTQCIAEQAAEECEGVANDINYKSRSTATSN